MTPHDIAWTVAAAGLLPVAVLLAVPLVSDLWSLAVVGWRGWTGPPAPAVAIPRQRLLVLVAARVDSSVCAALAVEACGARRVLGLALPESERVSERPRARNDRGSGPTRDERYPPRAGTTVGDRRTHRTGRASA